MTSWEKVLGQLGSSWQGRLPAREAEVLKAASRVGITFPEEYVRLLQVSNGGEISACGNHIQLWPVEQLPSLNAEYLIRHYLPHLLGIGSDGGPDCIAYDLRGEAKIVRVPFGDLSEESIETLAASLEDLIVAGLPVVSKPPDDRVTIVMTRAPSSARDLVNLKHLIDLPCSLSELRRRLLFPPVMIASEIPSRAASMLERLPPSLRECFKIVSGQSQ